MIYKYVCIIQGCYFFLSGLWPLISITTFQKVTGPKEDLWLVKTIGLLIVIIGSSLIFAGFRGAVSLEILILGIGSALGLSIIEAYYVMKRRISRVYLLDTFVEIVFAIFWLTTLV